MDAWKNPILPFGYFVENLWMKKFLLFWIWEKSFFHSLHCLHYSCTSFTAFLLLLYFSRAREGDGFPSLFRALGKNALKRNFFSSLALRLFGNLPFLRLFNSNFQVCLGSLFPISHSVWKCWNYIILITCKIFFIKSAIFRI